MSITMNSVLQSLIKERGWTELTEVQKLAYEPISLGYNVLIVAPTGYGKTEAAILPILNKLVEKPHEPVAVLYITPLKALINDLTVRISWWADRLGLEVGRKHGEVSQSEKNRRLRRVPHILITTVEGLEIDLDWATRFREFLKNVKWVIIDEVHDLVGTKRGAQLSVLLERLKDFAGHDFQRIGLSATIGNLEGVLKFLNGSSARPAKVIKVLEKKKINLKVVSLKGEDAWKNVAKYVKETHVPPTLLFTNSRYATERLFESLEQLGLDNIYVHHSSISREEKTAVEEALRQGKGRIVVCTRTLELGIHVGDIKKVYMFRPPPTVMSLLQRLGRSGHAIGKVSEGEILCVEDSDVLEASGLARLAARGELERPVIVPYLDVVAREITAMVMQYGELDIARALKVLKSSYVMSKLKDTDVLEAIEELVKNGVLERRGDKLSLGKSFFKIWRFEKNNNIPWFRSFQEFFSFVSADETFTVNYEGKPIGEIDAPYVYRHVRPGDTIRIAGKIWRVKAVDNYKMRIEVEKLQTSQAEIPLWKGDVIPKSPVLVKELKRIIKTRAFPEELKDLGEWLRKNGISSSDFLLQEQYNDEYIYFTLVDERVSNTVAHLLLSLAVSKYGTGVAARASIYGFSLKGVKEDLFRKILEMDEETIKKNIIRVVMTSPYFISTLREIQASFGKVGKPTKEDRIIVREALRQTLIRSFSIKGTIEFLRKIKEGKTKVYRPVGPLSPFAKLLLNQALIRPWIGGYAQRIYEELKETPMTLEELSQLVGLPEKVLSNKLKRMRKPGLPYRVTYFVDVETKDIRWVAVDALEKVAKSPEFLSSFTPSFQDESYIVSIKPEYGESSSIEFIVNVKDLENPEKLLSKISVDEIGELKIKDPYDTFINQNAIRFYSIPKRVVPYLVLNAITYYQNLKYG
ncbi:MAG: DEAD/DEAH box helicase [Thermoprotei archaeon]